MEQRKFIRPAGHNCCVSTGIHGYLTFGSGELDGNGFWENPCDACARAHEEQFPGEDCWPHTEEFLRKLHGI
jgi:hypothetical protein